MKLENPGRAIAARHPAPALERLAHDVSAGKTQYEIVRALRGDVLIARADDADGRSVIIKLWNRRTIKGAMRRLTRTNAAFREWRTLSVLHGAGVSVPRPLAYVRLSEIRCAHTEALLVEDLGKCPDAMVHMRDLIARSDWEGVARLEAELLDTTAAIVDCGFVDIDHRLNNFLLASDGRLVRIDFEHGVPLATPLGHWRLGVMLGTLVGSYVFAVQPRVELATAFAERLSMRLNPPRNVLRCAGEVVQAMLRRQRETVGLDTQVPLSWA